METTKKESWLKRLLDEIEDFDPEMFPPDGAVDSGEKVLGICTQEMRQTYSLCRFYAREAKQAKIDMEFSREGRELHAARFDEAHDRYKLLLSMFWAMGQSEFDAWGHMKAYGVREGWKFVELDGRDDDNPLRSLLERLQGL